MHKHLTTAKKVAGVAAQMGAGKIVYSIVNNNVTPTTRLDKVTVGVASFALGGVVAEQAKAHLDRVFDELSEAWNKAKSEMDD